MSFNLDSTHLERSGFFVTARHPSPGTPDDVGTVTETRVPLSYDLKVIQRQTPNVTADARVLGFVCSLIPFEYQAVGGEEIQGKALACGQMLPERGMFVRYPVRFQQVFNRPKAHESNRQRVLIWNNCRDYQI